MKELNIIQTRLNAPKNQRNSFGKYNYRSAEDILQAVKPLLKETGCTLTLDDDIVAVGDRIYVKATATLTNPDDHVERTTAFAREPLSKKGSDESQITGAASSYARKYALNGLFAIDDNKDPDTDENRIEREERYKSEPKEKTISKGQANELIAAAKEKGETAESIMQFLNVKRMGEITQTQFNNAMELIAGLE